MVLQTLLLITAVIFCFVTALFVLSLVLKRNDIADVAWGSGILLVAVLSYVLAPEKTQLLSVMVVLAALWGLRLSIRIFLRNRKKNEDYRYKKWRDEWGKWFYLRSYLQVYLLQGLLMVVIGYVFVHASVYGAAAELGVFAFVGAALWCMGYFFEVVGDYQLDKFLQRGPEKGEVMTSGLWQYSRHPNYFGEVTMWWGMWLLVAGLPLGYIALVSPLMITFLILKVSGIPMLEARFADNPNFQAYKQRTSAFFPLLPKRE